MIHHNIINLKNPKEPTSIYQMNDGSGHQVCPQTCIFFYAKCLVSLLPLIFYEVLFSDRPLADAP